MAHSKESHTKKDHLCCIFHQGDVGENVAKHFKELLLQKFGRESRIIFDWNETTCEDLPDTIMKNIKRSKFCLFIYSLGCDDEQFMSYWKQANALALSKKAQVISLRVKPFSIKGLCEAITTIHNPIAFNENFSADEKWDRILEEMQDLLHPESRGADNPRVASEVTDSVDSTTQQDLNAATSSISDLTLDETVFFGTLKEVVEALRKQLPCAIASNEMTVSRHDVWEGAKKAFTSESPPFQFNAPCFVKFEGETSIDAGGPGLEAFTLLLRHIAESFLFYGDEHSRMLSLDQVALREGRYKLVGQILAYTLVHFGLGPRFCSPLLYSCIAEDNSVAPRIDDIDDPDIRAAVKKIDDADKKADYDAATEGEGIDTLINTAGCLPQTVSFETKSQLVEGMVNFYVIGRIRDPLNQFRNGLRTLGVLDAVRAHTNLMQRSFVYTPKSLTAEIMKDLFQVPEERFSPIQGARRTAESKALEHWRQFLTDLKGDVDALSCLLQQVTGADSIPALGFRPQPSLRFIHEEDVQNEVQLIHISTCAHELGFPCVANYDHFKALMLKLTKEGLVFSES